MTRLSVNVNKIALLRNSRNTGIPSVIDAAKISLDAGAHGITVHPRPDQRHIRPQDVFEIADLICGDPDNVLNQYAQAASEAQRMGIGVNAGHDLDLQNLSKFLTIPNILEVSIGHALIADAIKMGLLNAVKAYLMILDKSGSKRNN